MSHEALGLRIVRGNGEDSDDIQPKVYPDGSKISEDDEKEEVDGNIREINPDGSVVVRKKIVEGNRHDIMPDGSVAEEFKPDIDGNKLDINPDGSKVVEEKSELSGKFRNVA